MDVTGGGFSAFPHFTSFPPTKKIPSLPTHDTGTGWRGKY